MSDKVRVRNKTNLQKHRKNYNTLKYIENRLMRRQLKTGDVLAISATLLISLFDDDFEHDLYDLVKKYYDKYGFNNVKYKKRD